MIIVGLGNLGTKYQHTRHNIGWMVLDAFFADRGVSFEEKKIFHALLAQEGGVVFAKPTTFMNRSGEAVAALIKQYGEMIVVIHDDIDIPLGEVKCSYARGSGDHNGVQSIIDHLGHKDFFRIRVGVRPVHEELLPRIAPPDGYERFLLDDFSPLEQEDLKQGVQKAVTIIGELTKGKAFQELMNEYN